MQMTRNLRAEFNKTERGSSNIGGTLGQKGDQLASVDRERSAIAEEGLRGKRYKRGTPLGRLQERLRSNVHTSNHSTSGRHSTTGVENIAVVVHSHQHQREGTSAQTEGGFSRDDASGLNFPGTDSKKRGRLTSGQDVKREDNSSDASRGSQKWERKQDDDFFDNLDR